jgi:3-oxoadipate enol-lactonase
MFTTTTSVPIHWQERGQGTPILLVMGHRFSGEMWYPAIPALAAKHRVIWFDNRGSGKSGASKTTSVPEMARDAFAVMDAAGVQRCHVYGISMGGVLVLEMAMQHPERVQSLIVGCSGMLTADKPRAPGWVRWLYYLPRWILKRLTPSRRGDQGYGSAAPRERVVFDQAMVDKDVCDTPGVIAQAGAVAEHSVTKEAVAALTVPALVIHGEEDALVPCAWGEELADTLPNARFLKIKGAGHNFLIAGADEANAAVLSFVAEVEAAG